MNDRQSNFIGKLREISPEEFRAKVEAAERAVKRRKAVRAFMKQATVGLVIGLIIGGSMAGAVYLASHGGF